MKPRTNHAIGPQGRGGGENHALLMAALFLLVILAAISAATQFFAHQFQYHAALGAHLSHLYAPWKILQWAGQWQDLYATQFTTAGSVGTMVAAAGLMLLMALKKHLSESVRGNPWLHGSARWADKKDIVAAGLLPRNRSWLQKLRGQGALESGASGVYVGAWLDKRGRQHYLRHAGPEHVLCYAPTRSGKGVGLIVPTLLSWGESAVITDLKGELWEMTAGWRKLHAGNRVLRFEPASMGVGAHWNPLNEIRAGSEHEVGDVQNLATLIVDPDGRGLETHWQKSAQALLVGLILHALYEAKEKGEAAPSLFHIDALLSDPDRAIAELWMEMFTAPSGRENQRIVVASARDMMDRVPDEAASVLSTVKSYLSLYRDPVVRENTADSHFCVRDLMHHADPVSLYIVTRPTDKARLRPLIRILLNMIVRLLADRIEFEQGRPRPVYRHRLLMMLDEFPSLGKLEILQESLAFLAGYGIKCYLICQDINQLKSAKTGYGQDESITSNCHIQAAFPPNRVETAEHLSKLTGQTTVTREQVTKGGKHTSRTLQEVQRSLLTVDECLRMPGPVKGMKEGRDLIEEAGDMIIYVAGYPAIYGRQPLYFQDEIFQARAEVPAPGVSDRL
ncbi:MAG: type IV secretory system conjugative DNA transfer family protein [Nitrosospira sp.]|nr:type IV secretory system conjugative DNA transfer family protein [Nitrosospira sp.]